MKKNTQHRAVVTIQSVEELSKHPATKDVFPEILRGISVVSNKDAEAADFAICSLTSNFPDDRRSICTACHISIYYRPYCPIGPRKVCVPCALKRLREEESQHGKM